MSAGPRQRHWLSVVRTGAVAGAAMPAPSATTPSSKKNHALRARKSAREKSMAAQPMFPSEAPPAKARSPNPCRASGSKSAAARTTVVPGICCQFQTG